MVITMMKTLLKIKTIYLGRVLDDEE